MKGINKMGGLARGCEPDGTADELPKKEGEAAKRTSGRGNRRSFEALASG